MRQLYIFRANRVTSGRLYPANVPWAAWGKPARKAANLPRGASPNLLDCKRSQICVFLA